MALADQTLSTIGILSAEVAAAEPEDSHERLAAVVAACRSVEQRALAQLAGRVSQAELLAAQVDALAALGW